MLIAKGGAAPESAREWVVRLEAKLRQAAATNRDAELFPGHGKRVSTLVLSLALLVGSLASWIVFLLGASWFEPEALRFGFAGLGALLGLGNRLVERAERRRLRALHEGLEVGLGALVQANQQLFDPKDEGAAYGLAVVTFDPALQAEPRPMIELARQLFTLAKESDAPPPEELRAAVERTRSEEVHFEERLRLPRAVTGNDRTFLLDLFFYRSALPRGAVDRLLWPVILHREDRSIPPQVPDRALWWSPELDRALRTLFFDVEEREAEAPLS